MIILDTNVVSALMRDPPDPAIIAWLDRQPPTLLWVTAITVLENRFGIARMPAGGRRDALAEAFERVIADDLEGRVLAFDSAAAEPTAALMARRQAEGRAGELRDSMIAGIALARRATLATRNVKHFDDAGLDIVDPWKASLSE
jgi:predicted nucleic acid-binding protein